MIQLTHAGVSLPAGSAYARLKAALLPGRGKKGSIQALDDFTLWIGRGESWAVLGEKDAGKTTFLRLIAKHVPASAGTCTVHGHVAAAIAQEDGFFKNETGESNARIAIISEGVKNDALHTRIKEVSRLFGDDTLLRRPIREYTPSARAKLSVAMALAAHPDVLVISSQLERCEKPFMQQCIFEIRRMLREGTTLLLECEDETLLGRLCESALWIKDGKLRQLGVLENVQASKRFSGEAKREAMEWIDRQQVAFSAPLTPQSDNTQSPDDVARAMREAQQYTQELENQLKAYEQAYSACEEENTRLKEQAGNDSARIALAEELLNRLLNALAQNMEIIRSQFVMLQAMKAPEGAKHAKGKEK